MKPFLTVLVPSYGRPHTVAEMTEAFRATCTAANEKEYTTRLVFVVDSVDPCLSGYHAAIHSIPTIPPDFDWKKWGNYGGPLIPIQPHIWQTETTGMNAALNAAAHYFAQTVHDRPFAIGFMGDDHRPRRHAGPGWDAIYLDQLIEMGVGIVFGNDLLQGPNLPTQVAMTSSIIRELGHMAPPDLKHLYMDNYWRDLGIKADCLRYLPDVVVEHLHPVAGKAAWDENYARVNGYDGHDKQVYDRYISEGHLDRDAAKLRAIRPTWPSPAGRQ